VIVPEMEAFAKQYGFVFRCHEIKHCNRKAGEERSFWTVETNFLPGRTFARVWRTSTNRLGVVHGAPGQQAPGQGGVDPGQSLRA
jgi:hypothetical protein